MPNPALRAAFLRLILTVIALHAVAIGVYYLTGIGRRSARAQYAFLGGWVVLTLLVVLAGLQRVRAARVRRR
jgi:nitric oxide reductase large subunit